MSCIFFTVLSHYKYNVKVITMQYIVLFFQQKISFTNNFTSINIKKAPEVNRTL
ncbi:hypothetical protein ALIPUT_00921 [Alistipes putredinis DSM 17216]|uniref:Uncharacterized protein n=1 Tax=Alistipes putredinis DSM 17216 TaxID=445970 RepID=B0MUX9_9BACT|nr:hypothetical protein ALIPUT_00921 [Alistipes putredinis DSM 17216]